MSSIEVDLRLILYLDVDRGVVPVKCTGYLEKALVDIGSLIYATVTIFTWESPLFEETVNMIVYQ